jgi:hypothetical protein
MCIWSDQRPVELGPTVQCLRLGNQPVSASDGRCARTGALASSSRGLQMPPSTALFNSEPLHFKVALVLSPAPTACETTGLNYEDAMTFETAADVCLCNA